MGAAASAVSALAALLFAGCSGEDLAGPESGDDPTGGSGAAVEDRDVGTVVEQTVVSNPESPDDWATVGITSLAVEGQTMVLRLVVTPDFASVSDSDEVDLGEAMDVGAQFFGVNLRLLDRENLKEYSVIHDGNMWWASAAGMVGAVNGEPMHAFAVFAAPEDDIDSIDVRLDENWPELTDVPITR